MLKNVERNDEILLYDYFKKISNDIPYYYSIDFENWRKCMFDDIDGDGHPLFKNLTTIISLNEDLINGFIQFGISNFHFDATGKNFNKNVGIIRNLHFTDEKIGKELMNKSILFFDCEDINERYAYYHYFGMSCYARHGKLHESNFHIESVLNQFDFVNEHENVYYSKLLTEGKFNYQGILNFEYQDLSTGDQQYIKFLKDNEVIGGCELHYLQQRDMCYLRWIYINEKYNHQGLGTECLNQLFHELHERGYRRLDTDTADSNLNAQNFYLKTGFVDLGRTRSYIQVI